MIVNLFFKSVVKNVVTTKIGITLLYPIAYNTIRGEGGLLYLPLSILQCNFMKIKQLSTV